MADTKISALSAGTALAGTEEIPGVQSAATVKFTPAQIRTYVLASPLSVTGGTVTSSTPVLDATQTWNSGATTFTGIKLNVTNTASANASTLIDLQVAGTSHFRVLRTVSGYSVAEQNGVPVALAYVTARAALAGSSAAAGGPGAILGTSGLFAWANTTAPDWSSVTLDTVLARIGAGVIGVRGASASAGGALNFLEQTAPSAPSSNECVLYAEDNGSGKTRLMVRFPTGAAQVVATEP